MKRTGKVRLSWKAWLGALSLVLVLVLGLSVDQFSIVSHAQSQCEVTVRSANIRKEADSGSVALGSAVEGDSLTIKNQVTGSDGKVWYQVFVNAETLGYIRSDLVKITDGTTPATGETGNSQSSSTSSSNTATSSGQNGNEVQAEVEVVSPISASVIGGDRVRVRGNASTTSRIVTTVERGSALTITGRATGSDNNVWYQVAFVSNGAEVSGFIRSDYVELSGELSPNVEEPAVEPEVPGVEAPVVEETKDWETQLQSEEWYLLDMVSNAQYNISDLFSAIEQNKAAYVELEGTYKELQNTVKSQKLVVIILVILLIGLGAAVAFLVFRIKDMTDSAYISSVERDMRRRNAGRPQGSRPQGSRSQGSRSQSGRTQNGRNQNGQKVMHTVGAEKKTVSNGQGGGQMPNKPAGGQSGSKRVTPQSQENSPVGQQQTNRPAGQQQANKAQKQGWKSKNFMSDDDEFEFEFLNWDGEEE